MNPTFQWRRFEICGKRYVWPVVSCSHFIWMDPRPPQVFVGSGSPKDFYCAPLFVIGLERFRVKAVKAQTVDSIGCPGVSPFQLLQQRCHFLTGVSLALTLFWRCWSMYLHTQTKWILKWRKTSGAHSQFRGFYVVQKDRHFDTAVSCSESTKNIAWMTTSDSPPSWH